MRVSALHRFLATTFASLAVPDFRYLWMGTYATQIGQWLQQVAQGWLAYTLTDSAVFLGMVAFSRGVPSLLLTLPGGVIADRWDRQRIMVSSQFITMVNACVLAWLVWSGNIQPWHLLVTAMISGATQSFNQPARHSLAPQLVGEKYLANAVALNAISFNSSRVLGPALAGIMIGFWGISACYVFQGLLSVWAMIWTLRVHLPAGMRSRPKEGSAWESLLDGLRFIWRSPSISMLLGIAAVPILLGMIYMNLMPVFARDVLQVGATGMGTLMASVGVGATIGSFVSAALSEHEQKGLLLLVFGVAFGAGLMLFAVSHWVALSVLALAIVGGCQAITQSMNQTLMMTATPNSYRGRVMSVMMLTWGLQPMVLLPAGWLTDHAGPQVTMLLSGLLVMAIMVLIGGVRSEIRNFREADLALERGAGGRREGLAAVD